MCKSSMGCKISKEQCNVDIPLSNTFFLTGNGITS